MIRRIISLIAAIAVFINALGFTPESNAVVFADSVADGGRFEARELILPAGLIGVGVWGVAGGGIDKMNRWANDNFGIEGVNNFPADILQFIPDIAMLVPVTLFGKCRYSWRERALLTVTGEIMTEIIVQSTKRLVHQQRPDGSDYRSFPSGHTARAFMGAELLRECYGNWIGVAAYTVAGATGMLRLCGKRHNLTDILAGAGVGILSARLAVLLLPYEKRWLGMNNATIVPTVNPESRSFTLSAAFIF